MQSHAPHRLPAVLVSWCILAALAAAGGTAAANPPEEYAVKRIDQLLGNFYTWARAINENGDAVGYELQWPDYRAFVYTYEHGAVRLPQLAGYPGTQAVAVSDRDANGDIIIAGAAGDQEFWPSTSTSTAVYWRYSTVTGQVVEMVDIGRLPGRTSSQSRAVNNNGMIVGFSRDLGITGAVVPHVYNVATQTLSAVNFPAVPVDINNHNMIAGERYVGDLNGAWVDLGIPSGVGFMEIVELNDAGHVSATATLTYRDSQGRFVEAAARHTGQWQVLTPLGGLGRVYGSNNLGDMVGVEGVISDHPFILYGLLGGELFDPFSLMTPLQRVNVGATYDINNHGQIVAGIPATLMTPLGRMIIPGDVNGDAEVRLDDLCAWRSAPVDLDGDGDADADDFQWLLNRLASLGHDSQDCNGNGVPDACDIIDGTSADCNGNGIPDDCEPDCDGNGVPDDCEADCNGNGIPDGCDIASGFSQDCNRNGIPDECDVPDTVVGLVQYNPPQLLVENSTFVSTVYLADPGTVADVDFTLNVDYRIGNATVRLSHAGVTVTLIERPGYNGFYAYANAGYRITLDDQGAGPNIQTVGNYSGNFNPVVSPPAYRPNQPLSAFNGLPREGEWTLEFIGAQAVVANPALHSWSIIVLDEGVDPGNCCPADWNDDGLVNSSDISAFITSWLESVQTGTLDADFNEDEVVNSSDISAFITAWLAAVQAGGC